MNNLEEEYKARFKDAESLEGIDTDMLWAQIEQQLPNQVTNEPVNKSGKGRSARLLLLLLLLGYCAPKHNFSGLGLSVYPLTNPVAAVAQESNLKKQNKPDNYPLVYDNKTSVTTDQNSENYPAGQHFHSVSKNKPGTKRNTPYPKATASTLHVENPFLTVPEPERQVDAQNTPDPLPILPVLAYRTLQTGQTFGELPKSIIIQDGVAHPKKSKEKKWQSGLIAGAHYTTMLFSGTNNIPSFSQTLNKAHTATPGYSLSVALNRKLNRNVYLSTGLGYIQAPSKFEFVRAWDTVMYRNQNPNADLIRAKATRTVLHHNQTDFIHLPVAVGIQKPFGKLDLGIQAGVGFNFILVQKGKSINKNGNIALITKDLPAFKPFFYALNAQAFLAYHLNGNMTLRMDYTLRYQHHGSSDYWGIKASSIYSGVGAGCFWAF